MHFAFRLLVFGLSQILKGTMFFSLFLKIRNILNGLFFHAFMHDICKYVILTLNSKQQIIILLYQLSFKVNMCSITRSQQELLNLSRRKQSISDISVLATCTQVVDFMLHTGDGIYDQILQGIDLVTLAVILFFILSMTSIFLT